MADQHIGGPDRRQTLKCMLWAGTGVVWTVAGGVPASRLIGSATAAEGSFSFVQMSDSHIGFSKPANPDARATLEAAVDKVLAMPGNPAFMIHTGDITHTAKPQEFDDALEMIKRTKLDVHYAPGEHDITGEQRQTLPRALRERRPGRTVGILLTTAASILWARQCGGHQDKTAWARWARNSSRGSRTI